ncbi:hypothetical protein T07_5054 [Trichinella nelsoni]|uniref:Uncharacterized protein n=1 Tax=Trichinella nelsoni TaxID=6336 RepID=A0A0V0SEG3_9BILA|nr:hypothetical protein T07_5054 [Trichinella nelsoni]
MPLFRHGEVDESRETLNGMNSTALRTVSDWIHLDGRRHEPLSLLRLPLWFPSSHFPCQALDSAGKQVLHERSPGFQGVWRQLSLYHREESVEAAQVCAHVFPQSSQFQKVAAQVVVEPRQLGCSVLESSSKPRKLRLSFGDAWKLSLLESLFAYTLSLSGSNSRSDRLYLATVPWVIFTFSDQKMPSSLA